MHQPNEVQRVVANERHEREVFLLLRGRKSDAKNRQPVAKCDHVVHARLFYWNRIIWFWIPEDTRYFLRQWGSWGIELRECRSAADWKSNNTRTRVNNQNPSKCAGTEMIINFITHLSCPRQRMCCMKRKIITITVTLFNRYLNVNYVVRGLSNLFETEASSNLWSSECIRCLNKKTIVLENIAS